MATAAVVVVVVTGRHHCHCSDSTNVVWEVVLGSRCVVTPPDPGPTSYCWWYQCTPVCVDVGKRSDEEMSGSFLS